jgi:hypothetical protein
MGKKIWVVLGIIFGWTASLGLLILGFKVDDRFNDLEARTIFLEQRLGKTNSNLDDAKLGLEETFTTLEGTRRDLDYLEAEITLLTVNAPVLKDNQSADWGEKLSKLRDLRRLSDMHQLVSAQGLYHAENGTYYTSAIYPDSIGFNLNTTPLDPVGGKYGTITNEGFDSTFCYYARLENPNIVAEGCSKENPCYYYTAAPEGNFYKTTEPVVFGTGSDDACGVQK